MHNLEGCKLDIIFIHDLAIDCVIGVWDWERETLQTVYLDLDFAWDISAAGRSDRLEDTLSYKEIAAALFISLPTAKTHVMNIYQKTGVNSKVELINLIIKDSPQ